MPGTLTVNIPQTFSRMLLLGAAQKMDYDNPDVPDLTRDGQAKYEIQVAVTYLAEAGRKAISEVISVGIIGGDLPTIDPGTQVEFGTLRVGVSAPTSRGKDRISGGRMWFSGDGLRAVQDRSFRSSKPAENAA